MNKKQFSGDIDIELKWVNRRCPSVVIVEFEQILFLRRSFFIDSFTHVFACWKCSCMFGTSLEFI